MVDYFVTGITTTDNFTVYTGLTPFDLTLYGHYPGGTTYIVIYDVPNNFKFYVVIVDDRTGFRTTRIVRTTSAYCLDICDGDFTLVVTYPPTGTPTVTPTITPTIGLTPSNTVTPTPTPTNRIFPSATPTKTPTSTITASLTQTPAITPSNSPVVTCGYYRITYQNPFVTPIATLLFQYFDCYGIENQVQILNFNQIELCIMEVNSSPQLSFDNGYAPYVTIQRISNCLLT